ncbi:MAG: ABC transporter ATP-binding protein [Streptococcaceae bacterium]|nr:ABC transporter ATP-binding protein [Streptococcaceae bacterium]
MDAIIVENLTKDYIEKKAVDNINFTVKKGEVFGFLGPNGAGKTTTVKLLNGLLQPTTGTSDILGINSAKEPVKIREIAGVVTEHAGMYDLMSGLDNLIFYGKVFGMNATDAKTKALHLLEKIDLLDAKDRKLKNYSTGMRQRLSLARALIHSPQILFLDEPTSGLDPQSIQNVNTMIQELAHEQGVSVFLCTHQLRYAQEICTSYGLIDNGALMAKGTLQELEKQIDAKLLVTIRSNYYEGKKGAIKEYQKEVNNEEEIPPMVNEIVQAGGDIYSVATRKPTLEEIYFELLHKKRGGSVD